MRWIFGVLALAGLGGGAQAQEAPALGETERILHVLSRLTFGPRPGQVEEVRQMGLAAWIEQQLSGQVEEDPELAAKLKKLRTLGLTPEAQRKLLVAMKGESGKDKDRVDEEFVRRLIGPDLKAAVLERGLYARGQLKEVLCDFWRNHFNVDLAKNAVQYLASHYEEAVIRAHVLGNFHEFLLATARHPAMLVYLDNALSRRPPSKSELRMVERRARKETGSKERAEEQVQLAKQRGLNENYARELLELHTLGVDNGYAQRDVEHVARAFTGWTIDLGQENGYGFHYNDTVHDPSAKRFLGRALPRGRRDEGVIEGEAVVKILAAHKNTARFISTKLCKRLVADTPSAELVEHGAKAFAKSNGDVREVVRAIVTHPRFFDRAHYRSKFKTPIEFVISALRATNAEVNDITKVVAAIERLGMEIYGCEDPTGYSDAAEAWRDPGVMALRWKFALGLARHGEAGLKIPESFYEGLPEDPLALTEALVKRVVPGGLGPRTAEVLERVVFQEVAKGGMDATGRRDLSRTLVGILLGSPEFQQQ